MPVLSRYSRHFQPGAKEYIKFKVITTFTVIADFHGEKNVAGDAAEVSSDTKPEANP
ncbi:hypothetical protein KCP78_13640 [Salmonella enterica subsp. enterica]|nr:hypothetical protein KCP78_13640 [Salmonella enterica subsp. enterica]